MKREEKAATGAHAGSPWDDATNQKRSKTHGGNARWIMAGGRRHCIQRQIPHTFEKEMREMTTSGALVVSLPEV